MRVERIPYLDPIELRYRSGIKVPVPTSKAVMFWADAVACAPVADLEWLLGSSDLGDFAGFGRA